MKAKICGKNPITITYVLNITSITIQKSVQGLSVHPVVCNTFLHNFVCSNVDLPLYFLKLKTLRTNVTSKSFKVNFFPYPAGRRRSGRVPPTIERTANRRPHLVSRFSPQSLVPTDSEWGLEYGPKPSFIARG